MSDIILYSTRSSTFLQAKEFQYSDAVVSGRRIEAMDFDPLTNVVYWSDSSVNTISRAVIPGDQRYQGYPQDLRIDVTMPAGIAFDYVTKVRIMQIC